MQLVSHDDVEDDIASMCRIWGVYVTAGVLGQYRDLLVGLSPAAIHEAVKEWIRKPPADRAARPHELLALAQKCAAQQVQPPPQALHLDLQPGPKPDLDQLLRELAQEHPQNPMFRQLLAERAARQQAGEPMTAEETAQELAVRVIDGRVLPGGSGTRDDSASSDAPRPSTAE